MHTTCTLEAPIFTLRWVGDPFISYCPVCRKEHWMTSKWPWNVWDQRNSCSWYPNFHLFHSYDELFFELRPDFREKCTEWPQNDWHVQSQKHLYAYLVCPCNLNFHPICSDEPFSSYDPVLRKGQCVAYQPLSRLICLCLSGWVMRSTLLRV